MYYTNREEAGELLYKELKMYKDDKDAVIVTIPRGGTPIGYAIADKLNLPLEIALSKKIGHPFNKEYAIGAVTLKGQILDPFAVAEVSKLYIDEETANIRKLLEQRQRWYYGNRTPLKLKGKTVILVDDGVATGNTLLSTIQLLKLQKPAEIIVALPVSSTSAFKKIKELVGVDNSICLLVPNDFQAVAQYYKEFNQVTDEEVIRLLDRAETNYNIKYPKVS